MDNYTPREVEVERLPRKKMEGEISGGNEKHDE